MDEIVDDFVRAAQRCERAARAFETEPVCSIRQRLVDAITSVESAWCGSWIGYQASVYTVDLHPKRAGEVFDTEWGATDAYSSRTRGEWAEFDYDTIRQEILRRAEDPDPDEIARARKLAEQAFDQSRALLLPTFDAILSSTKDETLQGLRDRLEKLNSHLSSSDFIELIRPKQVMSRDSLAIHQGLLVPPHISFKTWLAEQLSYGQHASALAKIARHAAGYLQRKHQMKGRSVAKTEGKVFIGHGHSRAWKDLKDFLVDRLELDYEDYEREPTAGLSTKERLLEMLEAGCFAFLVMTAEDQHGDGTRHARENVIHEAGLFQGRYGFERAIILLEEGCEEFSNIHGIGQIRFPKGKIMAKSEEIRRVLEREGIA